MNLTMLAKDEESNKNGCQSAYLVEDGMVMVQGPEADAATWANVENPLPGERGVLIKQQVLRDAARALGL